MIIPATISDNRSPKHPLVDDWMPEPEDIIFSHCKGAIMVPLANFYGISKDSDNADIDYFMLGSKRCYASDKMKMHICHYINYFEKFYDSDKELFLIYSKIKPLIDYEVSYTKENLIHDIKKYILSRQMLWKVKMMDEDNYHVNLTYKNSNLAICYTNRHAKLLMRISLLINMIIPLMCHFMYMRNMTQDNMFILSIYDILLDIEIYSDVDIYSKLYETAITNVNTSYKRNTGLWDQQDIRGKNITTHALECIENILLHVLPKYVYNKNIINLNFGSINFNNDNQVTNIQWEYSFTPLSSSNRDEDNNSEFDKYESLLIRADEALYLQNTVNAEYTMKQIEYLYGPFDQAEIDFYYRELDGTINQFQKSMVFNLFYKYFGDPMTIKSIDMNDYIKLVIASKRLLERHNFRLLQHIIGGKVVKLIKKKTINKKELLRIVNSQYFQYVLDKFCGVVGTASTINEVVGDEISNMYEQVAYDDVVLEFDRGYETQREKVKNKVLALIATVLISTFRIVDYDDPELHGMIVENIPAIVAEEILIYLLLT